MQSKQDILAKFRPRAVLRTVTDEARCAVPAAMLVDDLFAVLGFPFRVGRESRVQRVEGHWHRIERPRRFGASSAQPTNDLYLVDAGELLQISREHFQIEALPGGAWRVVDRGSVCGTAVGAQHIGGDEKGGTAPLKDGDTIVVGVDGVSPYRYQFIALD